MPPRRGIDLEDLERARAAIGERMLHPRGNEDHVVLANDIGLVLDGKRALAAFDDINVVGVAVVVQLAGWASRHKTVEVDVELVGAESGVDELDLLAAARLHRAR